MALFERLRESILSAVIGPPDGQQPRAAPQPQQPPHILNVIEAADNPWRAMTAEKYKFPHRGMRSMNLGAVGHGWMTTRHESHALVLAPSRSEAGKTSGVLIPNIISMLTPVVVTSTKADVVHATAVARAQMGRLWCYAPDGKTPIPHGVNELRWSPLTGSDDWDAAIRTARSMTETLIESDNHAGEHFKDRATDVLSCVFHWAAINDLPMSKAHEAALRLTSRRVVGERKVFVGDVIADELGRHPKANPTAALLMSEVMSLSDRELSGVASTASRALRAYHLPGAMKSTENPNFDPDDFVQHAYGLSTVYIISSGDDQKAVAPLVVALLNQIRRAQYAWVRHIEHEGLAHEIPIEEWTTAFVLDEMANIAPLPKDDLVSILTEGGSHGLLLMAAAQDLGIIRDRWRIQGESFLTLFQEVLVFPGIRDRATLEAVSMLIGDYDAPMTSTTVTSGPGSSSSSASQSTQRRRIIPPEIVARGVQEHFPALGIHLSARGNGTVVATPYYKGRPWARILAWCANEAAKNGVPDWLEYFRSTGTDVPDEPPLEKLPFPDIMEWARLADSCNDPIAREFVRNFTSRRAKADAARSSAEPAPPPDGCSDETSRSSSEEAEEIP